MFLKIINCIEIRMTTVVIPNSNDEILLYIHNTRLKNVFHELIV